MKKFLNSIIFIILILSMIFPFNNCVFSTSDLTNVQNSSITNTTANINDLTLYSDCLLLVEEESGDILYEKNAYSRMYPASTTKMLTAILVLENCYLNDTVTVSASAINAVPISYTTAHLQAGEQFTVNELLHAMLIPSANDAANVLAEHVSGSISAFAELMNKKAKEIGVKDSNFTNPSGIHDENLYTTAYDLSLIARYAMKNETFREIVSNDSYTLPATSIHTASDRILHTSNLLIDPKETKYYYPYATGAKTGFTDEAGDCLVASAKKDDIEFICVCLHAGSLENGLREKFLDCKTLFDFAFDNYTTYYKDLQEAKNKKIEEASKTNFGVTVDDENSSFDINFFRVLIKIIAVIIVLFAIKKLFFTKKKNRRKKTRNRRR